eukprot:2019792-Prymnesium_polylepis.2
MDSSRAEGTAHRPSIRLRGGTACASRSHRTRAQAGRSRSIHCCSSSCRSRGKRAWREARAAVGLWEGAVLEVRVATAAMAARQVAAAAAVGREGKAGARRAAATAATGKSHAGRTRGKAHTARGTLWASPCRHRC